MSDETPWDDCKVAFSIEEDGRLWSLHEAGCLPLPPGWSLAETDSSGARLVAIFRIEGFYPLKEDGDRVLYTLKEMGAVL